MRVIIEKGTLFYQGKFQLLGQMVIDGGKISEITLASVKNKKPKPPSKSKGDSHGHETRIDADGKYILPGFIDAHTHLSLEEEGVGFIDADLNEEYGLVTPHVRTLDALKMRDRTFTDALVGGVTTCVVMPGSSNPIGGQTCIVKLRGTTADDATIREVSGIKLAYGENPKRTYGQQKQFPSTRMGTAAVIREWLMKAQDYGKKKKTKEFKDRDIKLEALLLLLEGKIQARAHAHTADDIITAYRIAQEFNLDQIIDHCTEGHLIAKELGRWKAKAVVGPTFSSRGKIELRNKSYETARVLMDEGCLVALTTDHPVMPLDGLTVAASLCVRHGLDEDRAIKAICEYPAAILGLDKRLGKLEVGFDGDVSIWNGHPLDSRSRTEAVFIDGARML